MNFQPDKEAADIANGLFIRMEDFILADKILLMEKWKNQ